VRTAFGRWSDVDLMWTLPECLFDLPALERLTIDGTCVRTLPARPFASARLQTVVARHTLLLDVDPATHPQVELDLASSREWAASHVRYWFDRGATRYDITELVALLDLLFRVLVPAAEPYDVALEYFEERLSAVDPDLRDAIDTTLLRWEPRAPDLIAGVRAILTRAG
jgi:hypothetical protein